MRQDPVHPSSAPRRPRWVVPLVTLIGIALTAAAANWQLDRADQKERLQRAYDRGASDAAIRLGEVSVRVEDLRLRKVEAVGEFVPRGMVLLDNKIHNGQAGYEVIMPLQIRGSSTYVLVNRGWIAAGSDRARLPAITTPEAIVAVTGMATVPGRFFELSQGEVTGPVWQNLTVERYVARTGLKVQPIVIQQQNEFDDGLVRSRERPDFGIAKHYGYAAQWSSLCGLIIFLYIFFHVKSSKSAKNQEDADPSGRN